MRTVNRREFISTTAAGASAAIFASMLGSASKLLAATTTGERPMNVLFIAVDDLRPQLGCYGQKQMITPNMDALAAEGLTFNRAYCQSAICGPSRASLLTGLRPDTSGIVRNSVRIKDTVPDIMTLPQRFRSQGYTTVSLGKIYHGAGEDPEGWSEKPYRPRAIYALPQNVKQMQRHLKNPRNAARPSVLEAADVSDEAYTDGKTLNRAIETLRRIKDKPFFLATGFSKPHMPFACPKKYWDMYPTESIRLADNEFLPEDVPALAPYDYDEMKAYCDIPRDRPLTDKKRRQLIRGYYACTTYVDTLIGKLMAELERLKLRDNTIVILWGDHGWHLGENAQWGKHTNFEKSTRSPMILSTPGMANAGASTDALVEFVDIYPTLTELCGLSLPKHLEGTSFVPLLSEPTLPWKAAAFSRVLRWSRGHGFTMRTDRYRYSRWVDPQGKVVGQEIYDHKADPAENVNLANRGEHAQLLQRLNQQMDVGWRAAAPKMGAVMKINRAP